MIRGSNAGNGKIFFSSPKRPDHLRVQAFCCIMGTAFLCRGAKRLVPEADELHLSSDEAYNSGPHICLHGVDMDKFTVFMTPSRA